MPTPFLSSEEYDERAHQLYNEGQYDEALTVLREGLTLYPNSVELHVGVGYAQLAREEFAWARRSFEEALVLEPEHEDGLAGLGETLLKFGQEEAALRCFRRTLELGYADDLDLMLQIGRALFREGSLRERRSCSRRRRSSSRWRCSRRPESAEAIACVGYAQHRLGDDDAAIASLRRSLQLDNEHAEARIYLANILYDRGDYEAALYHFERTTPGRSLGRARDLAADRAEALALQARGERPRAQAVGRAAAELGGDLDDIDELFMELEPQSGARAAPMPRRLGASSSCSARLLSSLAEQKHEPEHQIIVSDGTEFDGSWEEIVRRMRDQNGQSRRTPFMSS